MNDATLASLVGQGAGAALVGLAFGLAYFGALKRTVELLATGGTWLGASGLTLARLLGAVVVLVGLAKLGAIALVSGFVGFLLARAIVTRSRRRT